MTNDIDDLIKTFFSTRPSTSPRYIPVATQVSEEDDNYVIETLVAGIDKKDIKISIEKQNTLKINSEKVVFGCKYPLNRAYDLPTDVNSEGIEAISENGVLKVIIPKKITSKKEITIR